jgi:hypothetical protein
MHLVGDKIRSFTIGDCGSLNRCITVNPSCFWKHWIIQTGFCTLKPIPKAIPLSTRTQGAQEQARLLLQLFSSTIYKPRPTIHINSIYCTTLDTPFAYMHCQGFSATHLSPFTPFHFILFYSFMFNSIHWIIRKKILKRFRNDTCH